MADDRPLTWLRPATDDAVDELEQRGYIEVRRLHQMRVPLPLAEHASITVRPFDRDRDLTEWLRVNNAAFHWHPDQGGWTERDITELLDEDWFEPAGFLVHDAPDGGLDGFCWTKVHPAGTDEPDDPAMGEIYVIAADPAAHGTGLGRQLTLAGLDHLAERRGTPVGMLYVEADNAPAVGLYRALGFTVHHDDAAFAPAGR